jgi:hypothetical protein
MSMQLLNVNVNSAGQNNPANTTPQNFDLFQSVDAVTGVPYNRTVFTFFSLEPNSSPAGQTALFALNNDPDPYAPWGGFDNFLRLWNLNG